MGTKISSFCFREGLKWEQTLFCLRDLLAEVLTCQRRWHYLQILPTHLNLFQLKLCKELSLFAMSCTHSTELKSKLLVTAFPASYKNSSFGMLHMGSIRVLGSKDFHLSSERAQIQ